MSFGVNKGVNDTLATRLAVLEKANLMLNSLLASLGSVYVKSNSFALSTTYLKAVAFEAARVIVTAEDIYNDLIFKTTRPEFIYQNIQSFLFLNSNYTHTEEDDVALRSFLLALIQCYFQGATKLSIQKALEFAIENQAQVELQELFLEGRGNDKVKDTIPLMHRFLVSIFVTGSTMDIVKLQNSITFLASLVKPAHTSIATRFVFLDPEDAIGFANNCVLVIDPETGKTVVGPDGFEVTQKLRPNAICDVFNMSYFDYGYTDMRKNCLATREETVTQEKSYLFESNRIKTRYGPLSNGSNGLLTSPSQLKVFVDGVEVPVSSIDALKGIITVANPISRNSEVRVNYTFLTRHFEYFTTNNTDTVLNQFDPFTETIKTTRYSSVLWTSDLDVPNRKEQSCSYRYSAFDSLNSSLLNDPNTLVFNKSSVRDKLNDYSIFKSYGYDDGNYIVELNYGVHLFPIKMEKTLIPQEDFIFIFKLNDTMSLMNSLTHNMVGGRTSHQAIGSGTKKAFADLQIDANCNNGATDVLTPVCEDGLDLFFDYSTSSNLDVYKGIDKSVDEVLVLNNSGYTLNRFELFFPSEIAQNISFSKLELDQTELDTYALIDEVISGFHQAIGWSELDYRNKDPNQMILNSSLSAVGSTGSLIPPQPGIALFQDLDWNISMYDADNFVRPRFVLNDDRSHLNDPYTPYGFIRRLPGNNDTYISDFLLEFETTVVKYEVPTDFQENFNPPHFREKIEINDFNQEFPITGYEEVLKFNLDMYRDEVIPRPTEQNPSGFSFRFQEGFPKGQVILYPYFLAHFAPIFEILQLQEFVFQHEEELVPAQDETTVFETSDGESSGIEDTRIWKEPKINTYQEFLNKFNVSLFEAETEAFPKAEDEMSSAINLSVQDGLTRGHLVLYPYFMANFAPIFDILQEERIVLSGSSYVETFTAIEDLYMNCFNPKFSDSIPKIREELQEVDLLVTTASTNIIPSESLISKFDTVVKPFNGISGGF